jgi:hypothetical protein
VGRDRDGVLLPEFLPYLPTVPGTSFWKPLRSLSSQFRLECLFLWGKTQEREGNNKRERETETEKERERVLGMEHRALCMLAKCPITELHLSPLSYNFTFLFLGGGSTGVWAQGLALTRQVLCHLSPNPFLLLVISSDRVSCFDTEPALYCDPPTYVSHVAGMTGACQPAQLVCWDEGLANFLLWLTSNATLPFLPPQWLGLQVCATMPSLKFLERDIN